MICIELDMIQWIRKITNFNRFQDSNSKSKPRKNKTSQRSNFTPLLHHNYMFIHMLTRVYWFSNSILRLQSVFSSITPFSICLYDATTNKFHLAGTLKLLALHFVLFHFIALQGITGGCIVGLRLNWWRSLRPFLMLLHQTNIELIAIMH